ncbi:MAG TPA: NAD(P)H-hydrate dehydratase [Planctomycetota bacterium]|nr:NAD(P)H-hydrate dehydratase [Planctomycetota bacterium]
MVPSLPQRATDANKGSCGRVLIVGGSRGMAGAPCLAARAAYRSGAGLVRVVVPRSIWDVVAIKLDECTTLGLESTREGTFADLRQICEEESAWCDVAVLGPGISSHSTRTLGQVRRCACVFNAPLVLDADALNAFALHNLSELGEVRAKQKNAAPLVLTPHPGEMARLLKDTIVNVQTDRQEAALACQKLTHGGVVVLKGESTVVTDGERVYVNPTGNPGMATGGTGDVLCGIIAALIGQRMSAYDAACLGVYLHGLAGDLAAKRLGMWSLIASDLIDELPNAFLQHACKAKQL